MTAVITDKEYPIQNMWLVKKAVTSVLALIPIFLFLWFFSFLGTVDRSVPKYGKAMINGIVSDGIWLMVGVVVLMVVLLVLRRYTYHYSIEEKFLVADQGIIAKQKKYLPYGRIQHIIIKRDLIDKLLGLSSVAVENASQGGNPVNSNKYAMVGGLAGVAMRKQLERQVEIIGFQGNKMGIPGLKQEDALKVQEALLQHVLTHLNEADSGSGL